MFVNTFCMRCQKAARDVVNTFLKICYNKKRCYFKLGGECVRFAIIDDLDIDIEILQQYINRFAKEYNIPLVPPPMVFKRGEAFLSEFKADLFDIIFLDIIMDGMDGMEVAKQIRKVDEKCRIVFITVSMEFAVDSYEVNASWYIVKPYTYQKFSKALKHCGISILEQKQHIIIGEQPIYVHSIAYTEYREREVFIYYQNGESTTVSIRQSDFSALLLKYNYFCDCVRGILVNFEAVEKLMSDSFLLKDGTIIPISRLKYKEVREKFLKFYYSRLRGGKQ